MTKRIFIAAALTFLGCSRDSDFLAAKVDPRYTKTYSMTSASAGGSASLVDILWVIDNSGSMGPYQQKVIQSSDKFIRQFTSSSLLQWKMGLIAADPNQQPYMGFAKTMDWRTANPVKEFNDAVGLLSRTGALDDEKLFDPVITALNKYPSFLRPGAFLAVIVVSDEEEQSLTTPTTADFIRTMVAKIGGESSRFFVYGVTCCSSTNNDKYEKVVKQTKGKMYDLLSQDYGTLLSNLGADLVKRITTGNPVVMLDQRPDPDTILVWYKGNLTNKWTYDPEFNVIRLDTSIVDFSVLDVRVSFELASN